MRFSHGAWRGGGETPPAALAGEGAIRAAEPGKQAAVQAAPQKQTALLGYLVPCTRVTLQGNVAPAFFCLQPIS